MNLSRDITLEQCIKSEYARRHGIENIPGPAELENLKYLAEKIIQPVYDRFGDGVYINSGFRCKAVNAGVGSSDSSLHPIGAAVDLDSNKLSLLELIVFIHNNLKFTELIAEYFPSGWVHAGIIKGRENEKKLKLKDANNNYEITNLEDIISKYMEVS
jgi:hypothetical protein